MPLGEQILIPGGKFLGVGGASRGRFSPNMRLSDSKDAIDDLPNHGPEIVSDHITTTNMVQSIRCFLVADPFETGVGPYGVEAQQQPFL